VVYNYTPLGLKNKLIEYLLVMTEGEKIGQGPRSKKKGGGERIPGIKRMSRYLHFTQGKESLEG